MAPRKRRVRSRRLAVVATAVVVSAALASGPGFAAASGVVRSADPPAPAWWDNGRWWGDGGEDPAPAADPAPVVPVAPVVPPADAAQAPAAQAPTAQAPAKKYPAFGAYLDYGPRGVSRMAELSRWLGGSELKVGHTYLPGDRWSNIEGAPGFLDVWADWRREKDDRMFVLNVPMQERNEEGVPDSEVRRLLRRGAAGEFDRHYKALAERLVALKVPDTVIVLGWEMNGTTYTHRCGPDPESWKKYWNRIVTTMRSVPGQEFKFDFTPSRGRDAVPWTQCYPGDDTVDIVGMDSYDQPTGRTFDEQVTEPYGLQEHVDFAKSHNKAISYPEWGLFRNGDNPEYMRRMLAWMDEHKPLYNTVTDYCPHGVWQCGANPRSSEVYRSMLSGRLDEPVPPIEPPVVPPVEPPVVPPVEPPVVPPVEPKPEPQPEPQQNCSPVNLGNWVEYWLGGKLCVKFDWFSRNR